MNRLTSGEGWQDAHDDVLFQRLGEWVHHSHQRQGHPSPRDASHVGRAWFASNLDEMREVASRWLSSDEAGDDELVDVKAIALAISEFVVDRDLSEPPLDVLATLVHRYSSS